ncbi:MAG TPA: aspartate ammonia-lyase [Stellaceae bacterium]|nr:aspartate ammonia-lyase [Stellaceae bacterium]
MTAQSLSTRTESDSLGEVTLPADCLYGINTARGRENFAISHRTLRDEPAFIRALAQVKKAAALANLELGVLPQDIAKAIVAACDEILDGRHHEHFVIDMLEGSGGTSINMNANEVITNRALQISGDPPGAYRRIHPNDHVNMGQSTNDVVPTALKLAVYAKVGPLLHALDGLAAALSAKSIEFAGVLRLGRTCLQSAQPMTFGQAFGGYAAAVGRSRAMAATAASALLIVPLGGTAIGTGLGAALGYRDAVLRHLADGTGWTISGAADLFDGMQNADAFARLSSELRTAGDVIGKIASDLVILSSGPTGGIGEVVLPAVQAGSSIMPGKINPVLPIMMQQVAFGITGNDLAVSMAALQGQLEINHFEPIMASRLFESLDLLTNGTHLFTERCIDGLAPDRETTQRNLLESSALATIFLPTLGYEATTALVKQSLEQKRPLSALAVESGLLTESEVVAALHRSAGVPVASE